jgi:hypothetical protein
MGCVYVGGEVGRGIRDSDSKTEGGARDTKNATRVLQGLISQVRVTNASDESVVRVVLCVVLKCVW